MRLEVILSRREYGAAMATLHNAWTRRNGSTWVWTVYGWLAHMARTRDGQSEDGEA